MKRQALAQTLKIAGLVVIGLVIAILLLFGIGEMASGDLSGLSHVIPAIVLGGVAVLSLKTVRGSGVTLMVLGVFIAVFFLMQTVPFQSRLTAILLTGGPILLGGLLLVAASGLNEKPEGA